MNEFDGQVVVVTGGTRGIGRGIAEAFLARGARVVATYTSDEAAAERMKSEQGDAAERLDLRKFDVADHDAVENFFRELADSHGRLDVVVNNAGIRRDQVVPAMPAGDWDKVIDTNLNGTFYVCKHAVKMMMRPRYGRIVNITSPCGHFGFQGQANYAASKAGQVGMTRSLSKEVATRNITVNCVSPGFIDTDLISDLPEDLRKKYLDQVPVKRFGSPADVAHAVLFLAGKEAAYITGTVLEVTGGL